MARPRSKREGAYSASWQWLKKHGLTHADAVELERAMCALIDYQELLREVPYGSTVDWSGAIDALRYLVDGEH